MIRFSSIASLPQFAACLTLSLAVIGASGCGEQTANDPAVNPAPEAGTESSDPGSDVSLGDSTSLDTGVPAGAIELTPENTTIEFVGSHVVEEKPDPEARHGKFQDFAGHAVVKEGELESIQVDIKTASLTTGNEKLDNHLKNADFFHVNQFPAAQFVSTTIENGEDGKHQMTGDLTLLETTKSVTFPATVKTEDGLTVNAEFTIDRTEFGINFDPTKVDKEVPITITVNAK
ncbi:YceI family protein [Thalassoglobus sp. JC818]|uniref:YceI family protein n=1 Tax=Thalassoglobus sp. JC818 TaxID=3232136 RepID=UPI003459C165